MTMFTRSLIALALTTSISAFATPSFDSLTIRATNINAPSADTYNTVSVDPVSGVRTDTQNYASDVNGWELKWSEQLSDHTYWFAGYRNDRTSFTENAQMYQPSPITIMRFSNETSVSTRQYSLGAGYIFKLSDRTTVDVNGSMGRLKLKGTEFTSYTSENNYQTFVQSGHSYATVAGYNARLRHEFSDDFEFYASVGGERWYADEDDTISVQTVGVNYFIFDETAISVEYGKYDDEERTAVGVHFTF